MNDYSICAGTIGAGIWVSADSGETFEKSPMELPYFWELADIRVYSMAVSPHDHRTIYAGSDQGLHISRDNGRTWHRLDFPAEGLQVWSLALDPSNPDVIFAGVKPAAVFRSTDAGRSWQRLPVGFPERCPIPIGPPRTTAIAIDPTDIRSIWAGAEVGGVFHSRDGGATWKALKPFRNSDSSLDIHGLVVSTGNPKKILVTTPDGIWTSRDDGESWSLNAFSFSGQSQPAYSRAVAVKTNDPDTILVGTGNVVFGDRGAIQRSIDGGRTWASVELPVPPNSTIYNFAVNQADPSLIVAASFYGYIYLSRDGGESWRKLPRELTEIRSLAWVPN
jgi:photosystem II stability/assembly factor-like uncharacterized protein